jgi:hypothetical protein
VAGNTATGLALQALMSERTEPGSKAEAFSTDTRCRQRRSIATSLMNKCPFLSISQNKANKNDIYLKYTLATKAGKGLLRQPHFFSLLNAKIAL